MVSYGQTLPFGQVPNCDDFQSSSFVHTVERNSFPDNWDWRDQTPSNWTVYMPGGSKIILSPFDTTSPLNPPNVRHLEAEVRLWLVDLMGRPVRELQSMRHRKAGTHEWETDLSELAAGIYTVILEAGTSRQTVKVIKQ